ncbi:MAG: 2-amino-4-hydroxy-6-hydroxymethyldihydropteridine diphosphokinase [Prevotella sp.]|nr:2-amino-4-hydroxy-6-hydroxymethyldihydropteridine diphosphokinase [Prevotella sp.]
MTKHLVYLGLGTNLGDRASNILRAIQLIGERVGIVVRQSSLIETEPWGFESPNKFLNAVILCETERTPREVLRLTQKIERDMGRKKPIGRQSPSATHRTDGTVTKRRYKDRPIDIDILLYDDITVDDPDLKIPHPLMHERDFVMVPLNEIRHIEISK